MRGLPLISKICLAVASLVFVIAIGDFTRSALEISSQDREVCPSDGYGAAYHCSRANSALAGANHVRTLELNRDFKAHERVYGPIAAVALLIAIVFGWPKAPERRRRFFATVGSGGVALLFITGGLLFLAAVDSPLDEISDVSAYLPAFALLAVAAVGGTATAIGSAAAPVPGEAHSLQLGVPPKASLGPPRVRLA
jgi:hypothetical protein